VERPSKKTDPDDGVTWPTYVAKRCLVCLDYIDLQEVPYETKEGDLRAYRLCKTCFLIATMLESANIPATLGTIWSARGFKD
jgi:hypothetical protein